MRYKTYVQPAAGLRRRPVDNAANSGDDARERLNEGSPSSNHIKILPNQSDWHLLPLTAGHAPSVLDLLRVAFARTEVPLNPPPGALRETADSLETQILRGGGAGAISGKRLIGSVLWTVADGLYVSRIAVLPEWRRGGVGSALLAACDDEARRRGQRRLHLETRLVLAGNLRLFARCGYREFARLPPDCDPGKILIKLEKWIE